MNISKYQGIYEKILQKIQDKNVFITKKEAYNFCKINNLNNSYPFPEDANIFEHEDIYSDDEYKKLKKESEAKIKSGQKAANEQDFNMFKVQYYDAKARGFNIPISEIAKNYFLSFQTNISNFRKGVKDLNAITQMEICQHFLKVVRDSVVQNLLLAIEMNPDKMNSQELYENFDEDMVFDDKMMDSFRRDAETAEKVFEILKQNETNAADNANIAEDNYNSSSQFGYENFSKQMFVDVVAKKYGNSPVVKKALSVYAQAQSEQSLKAQMQSLFEDYAKNESVKKFND